MNLLTENLPDKIDVEGEIIEIDTDYRNCLMIILAWEDKELTTHEKISITIDRLYNKKPRNIEIALQKAMLFLNCGEECKENKRQEKRIYSFEKDNKYIYSAVDKVLEGKLSEGKKIHWWIFYMAFMELPEDCMFSKIIYLRNQKKKGKLTKDERKIYSQMRDILELETPKQSIMTEKEQENYDRFLKLVEEGERR